MIQKRLYFIDNVRTLLICLVVMVHAAVTYGGEGGWYFVEPTNSMLVTVLLTIFNAVCQSFFMSLLFLVAGYFTIDSFTKTTTSRYLVSRLNRLGVPLLAFYVGIGPLTIYLSDKLDGTVFSYQLSIHAGPMWFAQALLIFTGVFLIGTLVKKWLVRTGFQRTGNLPLPVWLPIILFILLLWMTTIPARALWPMGEGIAGMQLGSFAHYSLMFLVGVLIHGTKWASWLDRVSITKVTVAVTLGIIILPIAMVLGVDAEKGFDYFMGGLSWQALVYAAWESFMCVMLSLLVTKTIKQISVADFPILRRMGRANYAVYIFHAPVLVLVSGLMIGVDLHPLIKFLLASTITITVCFPLSYGLTKLPILRSIL